MKTKFEKINTTEVKVIITIPKEDFEKYKADGLKKVQEVVQVDGFRKGHVPENMIIQKYGEMIILEEMAQLAINETFYQAIIEENENKKDEDKILPIVQPQINITKIGIGSDLEYVATFPIVPKVNLENYKKLSYEVRQDIEREVLTTLQQKDSESKAEDILLVKDEEVEEVLRELQKARVKGVKPEEPSQHNHDHEPKSDSVDESKIAEENKTKEANEELPPLDDEFAKSFGEQFKTIEDLRNKIKENLTLEKASKLQEKKRTKVLEKLVEDTKIDIPTVLIENELARMKAQTKSDVERYGGKWEEYLGQIKKTEEDLNTEWTTVAKKRVASQLIVNEIARLEKVIVEKEEIEAEAIKILTQMPEANENQVNSYVEQILTNEKVMKILDGSQE